MSPKSADDEYNEQSHLLIKTSLTDGSDDCPWSLSRVSAEIKEQMNTALPTAQSMVLTKLPWLISIRFVGVLGTQELAAAALATTLCNVTGLSFSVGLSSALTTLSGQAKGELCSRTKNEDNENLMLAPTREEPLTPLVFLFRGLIIQLLLVVPIGIWWLLGTESVLLRLGQQNMVSRMTSLYLKALAPGLWSYSISWTLTAWVQSIGMADVPVSAAVLGLVFHIPFNWFFIYYLGMGYLGCAVATVCFQTIQPIFILGYLFGTAKGRNRVLVSCGGHSIGRTALSWKQEMYVAISSLRGFLLYLALALPGIVVISEWWASELAIFLSGHLELSDVAISAMTIYQSANTFCFMFPVAIGTASAARTANLLGEGKPNIASFAGSVGIACAASVSFLLGLALFFSHNFVPSLFTNDPDVIKEASKTIPLLAIYVFADGIQVALNGIIKGCGRQWVTVPVVLIAYWGFGIPCAYYLAFIRHAGTMTCEHSYFCGVAGLVTGMTAGTWIHMVLLAFAVGFTTDWQAEALRAKKRVTSR